MRDKETGLTVRTVDATERYIAEHIVRDNPNYSFPQALRDAGYSPNYVESFSDKIWGKVGVQAKIASFKAKMQAKVELTAEKVLNDLDIAKRNCMDAEGNVVIGCMTNFLKIIELQGKYLAMWTENINTTEMVAKHRELDDREETQVLKIADLMLKDIG